MERELHFPNLLRGTVLNSGAQRQRETYEIRLGKFTKGKKIKAEVTDILFGREKIPKFRPLVLLTKVA